jgi:7-cyano-7-deazaguanine synthase
MNKAIVLCSGGLDSSVTAYYVRKKLRYGKLIILFFDYGQRTLKQERRASKKIASKLGGELREIRLEELAKISTSLINRKDRANKITRKQLKDSQKESLKYYVPCRNTVFLVYAMALAESLQIEKKEIWDIFTGFKSEGREAYPDTTESFVREMNKLKEVSSNIKGKIITPLIKMDKEDIIQLGEKLGVRLEETYSCYIDNEKHCGTCLACRLRQEGFYWANVKDKTKYRERMKDYRRAN